MTAALAGVTFALGLLVIARGWQPRPEPLATAMARLHSTGVSAKPSAPSWDERLGGLAIRRVGPMAAAVHRARTDLRIVGRSPDEQAGRVLVFGMFGLFLGPWVAAIGWSAGAAPPAFLVGGAGLIGAAVGVVEPWTSVRRQATQLRGDFLLALAAWCDMLAMTLAAGRGIEQAVATATLAGDGPAFAELRGALGGGHVRGVTPWVSLSALGGELGIDDLKELASTITLAGEDGVAVREAVRTKAHTIRERITSDTERSAERDTAEMATPTVAVALGFLVFLSYPGIVALSNGF